MTNVFDKSQLDVRSNPNLLINGCFSVDQRGINAAANSTYTLDRWLVYPRSGLPEVNVNQAQDAMPALGINLAYGMRCRATQSGTGGYGIYQRVEGGDFFNKTFTMSGKARAETGTVKFIGILVNLHNTSGTWFEIANDTTKDVTIDFDGAEFSATFTTPAPNYGTYGDIDYMQVEFLFGDMGTNDDVYHTHFKMEEGSFPTPFLADDPATNLAKCQRYFWSNRDIEIGCIGGMNGRASSPTVYRAASSWIPFPVTMRRHPSVTVRGRGGQSPSTAKVAARYGYAQTIYTAVIAGYADTRKQGFSFITTSFTGIPDLASIQYIVSHSSNGATGIIFSADAEL